MGPHGSYLTERLEHYSSSTGPIVWRRIWLMEASCRQIEACERNESAFSAELDLAMYHRWNDKLINISW